MGTDNRVKGADDDASIGWKTADPVTGETNWGDNTGTNNNGNWTNTSGEGKTNDTWDNPASVNNTWSTIEQQPKDPWVTADKVKDNNRGVEIQKSEKTSSGLGQKPRTITSPTMSWAQIVKCVFCIIWKFEISS